MFTALSSLAFNQAVIADRAQSPTGRYLVFFPLPSTTNNLLLRSIDDKLRDVVSLNLKAELYINSIIALSLIAWYVFSLISHNLFISDIDITVGILLLRLGEISFLQGFLSIIFFLQKKVNNDEIDDFFLAMVDASNPILCSDDM